jgi:16S rRNA (uracil1498-N3)-methyltransferase
LADRSDDSLGILGQAGRQTPPLAAVLPESLPGRIDLLIGPEGGLSEEEAAAATGAGFRPARIGPTVLRVETAAVAMLAAVMSRLD